MHVGGHVHEGRSTSLTASAIHTVLILIVVRVVCHISHHHDWFCTLWANMYTYNIYIYIYNTRGISVLGHRVPQVVHLVLPRRSLIDYLSTISITMTRVYFRWCQGARLRPVLMNGVIPDVACGKNRPATNNFVVS